jgi:protein SCO1/2
MPLPRSRAVAAAAALALLAAAPARAQFWRQREDAGTPPTDVTPVALEDVRVDERLGSAIPSDVQLVDWTGKPFAFSSLLGKGHPVVLALVYYECPMLCGLIQSGLARAIRENGLALGKDYEVVSVSFDPAEKAALGAERRRGYLQSLGLDDRTSTDWPFLVGAGDQTRRLADAVGFHYKRDDVSGEWAHVAALVVLTPDGKVSRYLYGIEYPPKDFRLALVEAADGKVGTSFDRFILTCYRYDPASRKYEPYAWGFVRVGGLLVLAGLAGLIGALVIRERKARHAT